MLSSVLLVVLHVVFIQTVGTIKHDCSPCICFPVKQETVADCTGQNLTLVPRSLPRTINKLILSQNNFTYLSKRIFFSFKKLTYLDLGNNRIWYLDKEAFSGLDKLVYLSMERNKIDCKTNLTGVFKPLKTLEIMKLNGNIKIQNCGYNGQSLQDLHSLKELSTDGQDVTFDHYFLNLTSLTTLSLSDTHGFCHIHNLHNNTFTFVPHLMHLNVSGCNLKDIDSSTFTVLKNIKVLDISENPQLGLVAVDRATVGLRNSTIEKLYINKVVSDSAVCVIIYKKTIRNLQNTPLRELQADRNRIEIFSDESLPLFPKTLTKLFLRQNRFTFGPYLKDMASLTGLEEVDISGKHGSGDLPIIDTLNEVVENLPGCSGEDTCDLKPLLQYLPQEHFGHDTSDTFQVSPRTYNVPPRLKHLTCTYSKMSYHITEVTFGNNSLKKMDLSSNLFSTWIGPVHGLENLKYLDLSNNIARNISQTFFHDFPGLTFLNVSYNFLGFRLSQDNGETFSKLKNLRVLDLSNNFITELQNFTFIGLNSIRVINMSKNNIHKLFIRVHQLRELHEIRCAQNQVSWIPKFLMKDLDALSYDHSVTLDLSNNPIACRCENLHFLKWLLTSKVKFGNFSEYFCMYNNGKKRYFLDDLDDIYEDLRFECYNHFAIALAVVSLFVLSVSMIVFAVAYRYRWKLRYWYYAAKLRYSRPAESCAQGEYDFDAFVSFSDEDRNFVVGDLFTKLEEEAGLRLNIHQRDFTPGRSIAQNIVNAVQISRRTIFILSEDFLASSWCRYELEMANMERVTTERDVILIIMYKSIKSKDIPPEITYHIKNDSYIQYPQYGESDVFWRSLIDALRLK